MKGGGINVNCRNRRELLLLLRDRGRMSRAELAKLTGLTRPTVSTIIGELLADGLVIESGKGVSCGGKRPIMLSINPDSYFAVGIDLGDDFLIRGVLCDLGGNVVRQRELEYENDFDTILRVLEQLVRDLTRRKPRRAIKGIGIAVSGIVDPNANEVVNSSTLDVERKGLAGKLARRCGFPVFLENRPNAAALAETLFGAGRDFKNLVYITGGRGVGAGIVIDGKIFRGSFGAAGEIGEMRFPAVATGEGGERKPLEEITRTSVVRAEVEKIKGRSMRFSEVLTAYLDGDAEIAAIMDRHAQYMAYAGQMVANLLNPEAIVLGGRTVEFGEEYLNCFKRHLEHGLAKALAANPTAVRYSKYGGLGVAVGGAVVVADMTVNLLI